MPTTDVVIVGAGPTGLFLAGELALQGIGVVVLERLREPATTIKAGSINVATAEILDRRGLLPGLEEIQRRYLAAAGLPWQKFVGPRFPVAGHFAGMFFPDDLVDQADPVIAAHRAVAGGIGVPQHDLELLLAEHCAALGVDVRRGVEVHDVLVEDVGVHVPTSAGGFTAGWLVAADGGRSVVRKRLGIEFDGTDPELVGYQAIADIDDPGVLTPGWNWSARGVYASGPAPGRVLVVRYGPQPADRDAPVTVHELQEVLREVSGTGVTLKGLRGPATRWSDNTRQARTYRSGRGFLAGDAAHVHPPFSGQGLNLGIGDAANLGWKLAATIRGWAPENLLDTYHDERHPIAASVLDRTRAQVALMRGDRKTGRLRHVVEHELFAVPGVLNHLAALTAGVLQHYDVGDDAPAPVGSIAGDTPLGDGDRLAHHTRDGRFVLVDRSRDGRFAIAASAYTRHLTYLADVRGTDAAAEPSLLIRPDGVIAWADTCPDDADTSLEQALQRWAGTPRSPA